MCIERVYCGESCFSHKTNKAKEFQTEESETGSEVETRKGHIILHIIGHKSIKSVKTKTVDNKSLWIFLYSNVSFRPLDFFS